MGGPGATILVADDDPRIVHLLEGLLTKGGYRVLTAADGREVLQQIEDRLPDLFVLDITMPEMDGLQVCRHLKGEDRTRQIPVIFISAMDETDDILRGFEVGAADYITKPVTPAVVLARVRTQLSLYQSFLELERLNRLALDANPLTGLPGNNSIMEMIGKTVEEARELCVIYCDIDHFKSFNDKYGFARGDKVILFTANAIQQALIATGCGGFFIGHIGGDDFTLIVPLEKAQAVGEEIARIFDEGIGGFYDPGDREAGGILSLNRKGEEEF
ncbi:MAG: response regulator, partial [Planctomycetota bacterium]